MKKPGLHGNVNKKNWILETLTCGCHDIGKGFQGTKTNDGQNAVNNALSIKLAKL